MTHGSPELDADAAKLRAMGQDPGMTLEDVIADLVSAGFGLGESTIEEDEYAAPSDIAWRIDACAQELDYSQHDPGADTDDHAACERWLSFNIDHLLLVECGGC